MVLPNPCKQLRWSTLTTTINLRHHKTLTVRPDRRRCTQNQTTTSTHFGEFSQEGIAEVTAVANIDTIITTATATQHAEPDNLESVDLQGTLNLIAAAKAAGVKHFINTGLCGAQLPVNYVPLGGEVPLVMPIVSGLLTVHETYESSVDMGDTAEKFGVTMTPLADCTKMMFAQVPA